MKLSFARADFCMVRKYFWSEKILPGTFKYTARSLTIPVVYRTFVGSLSVYIFLDCAFKVRRHFSYKPLDAYLLAECLFWGTVCVFGLVFALLKVAQRFRWIGIPIYLTSVIASLVVAPNTDNQFLFFLTTFVGFGIWRFFIEEVS